MGTKVSIVRAAGVQQCSRRASQRGLLAVVMGRDLPANQSAGAIYQGNLLANDPVGRAAAPTAYQVGESRLHERHNRTPDRLAVRADSHSGAQ